MKHEKSCGAIIFRQKAQGYEFLIVEQRKGRHWGFPKGHVECGETEKQTTHREIYEETGLTIEILEDFRKEIQYYVKSNVVKTVVFFLARALSDEVQYILPEIAGHKWLSFSDALKQLTFSSQKNLLQKAYHCLPLDLHENVGGDSAIT
ncbi:DNA mismatch repair protein MutT [candidate division KSB3 bacterium]|uniref:Bis(5'-nucleosyl)-tetraphosphatase [asymmetrical] n=1 Tax=candidate division KSB3 bacterium TaxID=2044937 RepID=A0A2G6E939_9BACT|nr:MAG: DNA mismatch repair protein MutT [candidate division KSB3 bacterium]PIE30586.1 MAG: DNA mismatch repair protein MutT [candidate division KSB3 bacterium]